MPHNKSPIARIDLRLTVEEAESIIARLPKPVEAEYKAPYSKAYRKLVSVMQQAMHPGQARLSPERHAELATQGIAVGIPHGVC